MAEISVLPFRFTFALLSSDCFIVGFGFYYCICMYVFFSFFSFFCIPRDEGSLVAFQECNGILVTFGYLAL